jgi:hypothetical protein
MANNIIFIDTTNGNPTLNGREMTQDEKDQFIPQPVSVHDDLVLDQIEGSMETESASVPSKGVADPDTLPMDKTVLKLPSGLYTVAKRGRRPLGATVYREPVKAPKPVAVGRTRAKGVPLDKKAPVMVRLLDGRIVPRGRGRPPYGSRIATPEEIAAYTNKE